MSDLYELTRKFVRRGCPEHPRLSGQTTSYRGMPHDWWLESVSHETHRINPDDAHAIWAVHAMTWFSGLPSPSDLDAIVAMSALGEAVIMGEALEFVEAATRHLEPA